jgi:hypothetical protein
MHGFRTIQILAHHLIIILNLEFQYLLLTTNSAADHVPLLTEHLHHVEDNALITPLQAPQDLDLAPAVTCLQLCHQEHPPQPEVDVEVPAIIATDSHTPDPLILQISTIT